MRSINWSVSSSHAANRVHAVHRRQSRAIGYTFSMLAKNQMQAMQMTFFFFLPSMLLSGFMLPFRGMPQCAQWLGEALPLTHFLRIVRGILLKGNGFSDIAPNTWPLALFLLVAGTIALTRYRETLD
jgi:ABC-2 type transport system permease protein